MVRLLIVRVCPITSVAGRGRLRWAITAILGLVFPLSAMNAWTKLLLLPPIGCSGRSGFRGPLSVFVSSFSTAAASGSLLR